ASKKKKKKRGKRGSSCDSGALPGQPPEPAVEVSGDREDVLVVFLERDDRVGPYGKRAPTSRSSSEAILDVLKAGAGVPARPRSQERLPQGPLSSRVVAKSLDLGQSGVHEGPFENRTRRLRAAQLCEEALRLSEGDGVLRPPRFPSSLLDAYLGHACPRDVFGLGTSPFPRSLWSPRFLGPVPSLLGQPGT
ncbi:hypothetical protein Nepgr_033996, partial [Nepenthes gracilis]